MLFLCLGLIAMGSIPSLYKIMQASAISHFWIEEKLWYEKLFYFKNFFRWIYRKDALIIPFWLLLFWSYYSTFSSRYKGEKYTHSFYLISFWVVLGFAIPTLYSFLKVDILFYRYLIGTLPAIQMALALGLARIPDKISALIVCLSFVELTRHLIMNEAYAREYFGK